jgi:hypothetical protein
MKVALIELGATHQEVLIPQLKILRESGVEVKIWASDKFIENTLDQSAYINSEVSKIPLKKNKLLSVLQCFGISKAVNAFSPDWVIFNTVAGPQISILSKLLSKNIRQAGIVHNTKKISSSKSVKSVCLNLEKIIVLNRELLKWIPNYKEKGFCFYPLTDNEIDTSKKSENVLKIVIPGQVEKKRRDYNFLIRQLNRIPADSTIRFNFLGNAFHPKGSGPELNDSINSLKNTFGIKLLSAPVPEKEFQDEINSSDLILPLITPTCEGFDNYLKYQIV